MTFSEGLVIVALFIGVAIGAWYQNDRTGGIAHMRRQRDNARRACDDARLERDITRAELEEAKAVLRQRFANHPSAAPARPAAHAPRLQLVKANGAVEA